MHMSIHWFHETTFIFASWSTDSWFIYFLGCILSGLVAASTIALPVFKKKFIKNASKPTWQNLIVLFFYYLLYATMHLLSMILIMTYNGGLILFMIGFMGLSYFLFGSHDSDGEMPINCCANACD